MRCYDQISDALKRCGRLAEAVTASQKGLAIAERLAASQPQLLGLQSDVSLRYQLLGHLLKDAGRREEGDALWKKGFEIFQTLTEADRRSTLAEQTTHQTPAEKGQMGSGAKRWWRRLFG
jgi:hypothetical protein